MSTAEPLVEISCEMESPFTESQLEQLRGYLGQIGGRILNRQPEAKQERGAFAEGRLVRLVVPKSMRNAVLASLDVMRRLWCSTETMRSALAGIVKELTAETDFPISRILVIGVDRASRTHWLYRTILEDDDLDALGVALAGASVIQTRVSQNRIPQGEVSA